nr:hypothetical protein [Verrucomicrobium spinosum]
MPLKVEMTASGRATRLTRRGSASTCSTIGDLSASSGGILVSLGHKLGLYKALAGAGPLTSQELADRADCAERYAREWLNARWPGTTCNTTR